MSETNKNKQSWLKKAANLLYEDVQEVDVPISADKKNNPAVVINGTPSEYIQTQYSAPLMSPTLNTTGTVDKKFTEHFEQLLKEANIPGPDYFEFKQAMNNMSGMPLDEPTKFKVAYASLSPQGLTKEKITASLDTYIKLLQEDKINFDNEIKEKQASEIQTRDEQISSYAALNESATKEIVALTEKINANNVEINRLKSEQFNTQNKLSTSSNNYNTSYSVFLNDLNADVTKITNYIQ